MIGILWKFFNFIPSQQVFFVVLLTILWYSAAILFSFGYSSGIAIVPIIFLRETMWGTLRESRFSWALTRTGCCFFWSLQQVPETRENGNRVEDGRKEGYVTPCCKPERRMWHVADKLAHCRHYYHVIIELWCTLISWWYSSCFESSS